jgi:hypothetical protein
MIVEILDCRLRHLRELAANLRSGDRAELEMIPRPIRHTLNDLWLRTYEPRCATVDGMVAACWGCSGSLLASVGEMWLFTTPVVEKAPLRFFKQVRIEVNEMLKQHQVLVSNVSCDYTKALRFFEMLGFSIGTETRLGPDKRPYLEIRMER